MKKYEYILLDWDGNLAKTLDLWLEACRAPLVKRGIHKTDEEIGASFGQFKTHLIRWGIDEKEVELIFNEADVTAEQIAAVELYPDALEVLEYLYKAGKKLALITTSWHGNIDGVLERYNMNPLFDAVVCGDDVMHHKPHPEPIEKGLELLGGNKSRAVMIGDSDKDLGAAQNAGIDSILFYPPEHKKFYSLEKLKEYNPTFIVEDFREIMNLV